ncbi:UNVERIFIED_CONTAM: Xanthoxin dehydrogenase [Sesamum calycinum]|uniref:Xanthoxin dehydrogenase n=1 Tax=Sesamum calycinum TaxID=2727403 RepID=A0AAW2R6B4_9LAMI
MYCNELCGFRLLGRVALVTGGAAGIGESIVRLFHKHGAKVCIADIQDDLGQRICESLGGSPDISFCHCDVTIEDDVKNAVDVTVDRFGTLDIMVNNAGIAGPPRPDIREVELSLFEQIFDVNVKGVFIGMKHAARIMIPAKKGSIISLASVASAVAGVGTHAYTGSKHAVVAYLPEEERTEDVLTGFRRFAEANANLQGIELTTEDVANAVLFLASDEARYISGDNLMVDGGFGSSNHSLRVSDEDTIYCPC